MTSEPTAPAPTESASAVVRSLRGPFFVVFALYALWLAALALLAARASNPPLLNLAQVSRASLIVVAVVEDLPTGRCRFERSFSPGQPPATLLVTNLSRTPAEAGKSYLLPLVPDFRADEGTYRVVEDPERGLPPLIYPAGTEIEAQLLDWQQAHR